jgi:hypothetical protein
MAAGLGGWSAFGALTPPDPVCGIRVGWLFGEQWSGPASLRDALVLLEVDSVATVTRLKEQKRL